MALARAIKQEARALGFDAVGIALVDTASSPQPTLASRLTRWLQRGFHATMAWMERLPEKRADPRLVLPGCRSIIVVGMSRHTSYASSILISRSRLRNVLVEVSLFRISVSLCCTSGWEIT